MPDHDPRIERIRADIARLEAAYLLFSHAPPKSPTGGGWRAALSSVGDFLLKAAPVATSVWVALVACLVNDRPACAGLQRQLLGLFLANVDRIAAANLATVYRLLIETNSAALGGLAPEEIRAASPSFPNGRADLDRSTASHAAGNAGPPPVGACGRVLADETPLVIFTSNHRELLGDQPPSRRGHQVGAQGHCQRHRRHPADGKNVVVVELAEGNADIPYLLTD